MKQITLSVLIAAAVLLTACGSSTPPATLPPAAQPVATDAAPSVGSGNQVTITLADNTITASETTFQAGVSYTFVITNSGHRIHNFNINPPVSTAGSLDAALSQALLVVTKDKLSPGATVKVEYTFPESAVGQKLEFSCLIQRHYDDGMRQEVTVTK